MNEAPQPIKAEIDQIVSRALPKEIAGERMRLLVEHADSLVDLQERAKRVYREMLEHEVQIMAFDGLSPRLAEQAARNNLGVRKADLDVELSEAVERENQRLHRRLSLLLEDLDD